jgi:far upstream element-binding protein
MIEELIESVLRRNGGGGNNQNDMFGGGYGANGQNGSAAPGQGGIQVVHEQYQFVVPASKCGIIIGRGGDTIKQINQQSGAYCEMDRKASANQTVEKTFTIKGEQHQVDEAKRLISEKINLDITLVHIGSATVTQPVQNNYGQPNAQAYQQAWAGYNAAQSWDQNQAAQASAMGQASANQPDYSQQWIEYYRQLGMHREADMIEQQVKAKQAAGQMMVPGAGPANGAAQAPGQIQQGQSQQDYSAEWAEYYRRIGKVDEAEAIEKQIQQSKQMPAFANAPNANPQMAAYQQYQQYYGANAAAGQAYQQFQQYGGFPGQQQGGQPPQPQGGNQGGNKNEN